MSLLSGSNLNYRIDAIEILADIDIDIGRGEMIGLIGPNGAGKSSLLRLLTGIESNFAGEVRLDDRLLAAVDSNERARRLGYLAQGARADWPFSVEKVVGLGRIPLQKWWQTETAEDRRHIEQAMARTETLAYRNRVVTTLSGGEQTLVMLARIFATGPELIFADEPVAALDPYHQLHVMEILREHARGDRSTVVVLHDLGLAARFCDRLYLLNHGRLHCSGPVVEVLTAKNIADVYGVESRVDCDARGVGITPLARIGDHHP
ncbi:MAG: ABC transporter ATP-binding protein [Gammaproteobacteria bacterium]|nr:ABC transporter ATP-binding protein [Gammaproteobacteria bacterium]